MDSYLDMDCQYNAMAAEKQRSHEQWVEKFAQQTRFNHHDSRARSQILVTEAFRQEKAHLAHQYAFLKQTYVNQAGVAAPSKLLAQNTNVAKPVARLSKYRQRFPLAVAQVTEEAATAVAAPAECPRRHWSGCACIRAPTYRLLTPKYRAMNLLREHYAADKLEAVVLDIQQKYDDDHQMMHDLLARYGAEPDPDPCLWLRCVEERRKAVDHKWNAIAAQVSRDMSERDQFPLVIRNLSIMRIFLEGSQAEKYGCDLSERGRRDSLHQVVLNRLAERGILFLSE